MKGNLLQGTARGRMGEIVASVRHGKQLFSKYQPNVNNPKSAKQSSQRNKFSRAVAFAVKFMSDNVFSNTYATLNKSARSLFNNIVSRILLYEALGSGSNLPISRAKPLLDKSINGNTFDNQLVNDPATGQATLLIDGALPTSRLLYFGSNTPFVGDKAIIKKISAEIMGQNFNASIETIESNLTQLEVLSTAEPKQGFHNSVEDCGNWPFIYSIQLNEESGFGESFALPSAIDGYPKIGDILFFSNENETIAYLFDKDVQDTEIEPEP